MQQKSQDNKPRAERGSRADAVRPGSVLYRTLELVARAVMGRLRGDAAPRCRPRPVKRSGEGGRGVPTGSDGNGRDAQAEGESSQDDR
jgi:hypothetical protein